MYANLSQAEFLQKVASFLGGYYLTLALMNLGAAIYVLGRLKRIKQGLVWLSVALVFAAFSPLAFSGKPELMVWVSLPEPIRQALNFLLSGRLGPAVFALGTFLALTALFVFRTFFVKPRVAFAILNLSLLWMGLSLTDRYFADIVGKPDNVAIVAMIYLLGYFTWLGAYKAAHNDARLGQDGQEGGGENMGPAPGPHPERLEKDDMPTVPVPISSQPQGKQPDDEKVLVWPDLVYIELICAVAVMVVLIVWSIVLKAPLEGPANVSHTPNPSKAPWYFSGLQEMLVYHDAWYAGVVVPGLIIFGLAAIPYLDFNRSGRDCYTIDQRRFAYVVFQFGFLGLWIMLIAMATFLRGPYWTAYGPYEPWDPDKVVAQQRNVHLSTVFWDDLMGRPMPVASVGAGAWTRLGSILLRESPGLVALLLYFLLLPAALARTALKRFYPKMGLVRYVVMSGLLLLMVLFPVRMLLYWTVSLRSIVHIPEISLTF